MVPSSPPNYERSPVLGAECDDLDRDQLQLFLARRAPRLVDSKPQEQVAIMLGLYAGTGGRCVPTVAGLILFGFHPQLIHPEWGVAAVRIRGTKIADPLLARMDLEGNLPQLLEQGLQFTVDHTVRVANLVNPEEAEREYPVEAVREALLNALIHRDYRLTGRVTLRIFDDRLEVWNPGGMPVQFSLEHLAQHGGVSFPRNPSLAATARALGLMEQIGRGLPTIRRSVLEASRQSAQFGASQSDFLVVLPSRLRPAPVDEGGN
jgi:ATP-dependent DNA helicase RecG